MKSALALATVVTAATASDIAPLLPGYSFTSLRSHTFGPGNSYTPLLFAAKKHAEDVPVEPGYFAPVQVARETREVTAKTDYILQNFTLRGGQIENTYNDVGSWALGDMEEASGMYPVQVKFGGHVQGGFNLTNPQPTPSPTPAPTHAAGQHSKVHTLSTVTTTAEARPAKHAPNRRSHAARGVRAARADVHPTNTLVYHDVQGREGKFYMCGKLPESAPFPSGTGSPRHPHPTGEHQGPTGTRAHAHPKGTDEAAHPKGTASAEQAPEDLPKLMVGYGTKEVPRECQPLDLTAEGVANIAGNRA